MHEKSIKINGVKYKNLHDACAKSGVSYSTFLGRYKKGWELERCLLAIDMRCTVSRDHKGRYFDSIADMAKAYGMQPHDLLRRLNRGWDLKDALTTPKGVIYKGICYDHLGHKFFSIKAMCAYWQIKTNCYAARIARHWSIKDALTKPRQKSGRKKEQT